MEVSQMKKMLAALVASLVLMAGLAFAAGGTVSPGKSFKITLAYAAKVGPNQMAPGSYKLTVDTASVRFVEDKTGKSFDVPAKLEALNEKFEHTAITTQKDGDVVKILEIRIGGTQTQISFR
jgi:hypothetical protein